MADTSNKSDPLPAQRAYRTQYEAFWAPLGIRLARLGITANLLSFLNMVASVVGAVVYYFSRSGEWFFLYFSLVFVAIASFFDMIDGSVARGHKTLHPDKPYSQFGAVFDPAMDRFGEAFLILGILVSGYVPPDWALYCFVAMIMASYVRARAESLGMTSCSVGIERKEKVSLLALGTGFEALGLHLTDIGVADVTSYYISYGSVAGNVLLGPLALSVAVVAVLSTWSTIQRLRLAARHL